MFGEYVSGLKRVVVNELGISEEDGDRIAKEHQSSDDLKDG